MMDQTEFERALAHEMFWVVLESPAWEKLRRDDPDIQFSQRNLDETLARIRDRLTERENAGLEDAIDELVSETTIAAIRYGLQAAAALRRVLEAPFEIAKR